LGVDALLIGVGQSARDLPALMGLAAALAVGHTLAGPDHYVPFLAMARVGRWSYRRTLWIVALCGLGHVLSSVLLGGLGLLLGWAVGGLQWVEGMRGEVAGWLLLGFGMAYLIWGIRHSIRNRPHTHVHVHEDGTAHDHAHGHRQDHAHVHADAARSRAMTPWILFTVFVFGPCEVLIPLLMYPAAAHGVGAALWIALVFSLCTIATMISIISLGYFGLRLVQLPWLERHMHALAGLALVGCGLAIRFGL